MAKLIREGDILTEIDLAESIGTRTRGMIGSSDLANPLLLRPANSVHTLFMRFPIDIAFIDKKLCVVDITTMKPWRLGSPRRKARAVLEAKHGRFADWNLQVGDQLEIQE